MLIMPKNTFDILRRIIAVVKFKPGVYFTLVDDAEEGLRLRIKDSLCRDAYKPDDPHVMGLNHYFPVPLTTWNEHSWRRWVFDCCLAYENHESGEWFRFDDERPFAPAHGPGENPYVINYIRSDVVARTTQNGSVRADIGSQYVLAYPDVPSQWRVKPKDLE
jgi:hypothetical protein